jgi:hypothetical protein
MQKLDLTGTTCNERLVFFVNVYNMLMSKRALLAYPSSLLPSVLT